MAKVCGPNKVGCCFSRSRLLDVLVAQIGAVQKNIELLPPFPTAFPNVSVSVSIDSTTVNFVAGTQGIELSVDIVMYLRESSQPQEIYNDLKFSFARVPMRVVESPLYGGTLGFVAGTATPSFTRTSGDVATNAKKLAVLKRNQIELADYQKIELAVLGTTNAVAFITDFVEGIPFPTLVDAMRTFIISSPFVTVFAEDYYVITGRNELRPPCICASEVATRMEHQLEMHTVTNSGKKASRRVATAMAGVKGTFDIQSPAPEKVKTSLSRDLPYAFYYPKEVSFTIFGKSVLEPAIVASDRGKWLAFLWDYSAFAALTKSGIMVDMSIPNSTVTFNFPLDIGGSAGTALRVGCVTVPLARVDVVGEVDKSFLTLKFDIVKTPTGWKLIVAPSYQSHFDVYFAGLPGLDILLNILMGSIGNRLISRGLGARVAGMQADLVQIGDIGQLSWPHLSTDVRKASALVGLFDGADVRKPVKKRGKAR